MFLLRYSFQFTEEHLRVGRTAGAGDASLAAPELELGIPAAPFFLLSSPTARGRTKVWHD